MRRLGGKSAGCAVVSVDGRMEVGEQKEVRSEDQAVANIKKGPLSTCGHFTLTFCALGS